MSNETEFLGYTMGSRRELMEYSAENLRGAIISLHQTYCVFREIWRTDKGTAQKESVSELCLGGVYPALVDMIKAYLSCLGELYNFNYYEHDIIDLDHKEFEELIDGVMKEYYEKNK